MKVLKFSFLIISIAVIACVHFAGIRWGVPTAERYDLLLGHEYQSESVYRQMAASHALLLDEEPLFTASESVTKTMAPEMEILPSGVRMVKAGDRSVPYFLSLARSFLIRSYEPDITNLFNAFMAVDPRRGDFFPDNFIYGIVAIGMYGGWLLMLSACRLVVLVPDMTYYLMHGEAMADIYVALRVFSFLVNVVVALLVCACTRRIATRWWGLCAAVVFLLLPVTINATYEVKPHMLAAGFVLGFFYACAQATKRGSRGKGRWYLVAACAGACAVGVVPTTIAYVAVGMMFVIGRAVRERDGAAVRWCVVPCGMMILAVLANVWLNWEAFWLEIAKQERFYSLSLGLLMRLPGVFFSELSCAMTWPVFLLGLIGVGCVPRRRWFLGAVLVVSIGLIYKFSNMQGALRFALPLVPVLCVSATYVVYRVCVTVAPVWRVLLGAVCVASIVWSAGAAGYDFYADATEESTRLQAGRWINREIPSGALVGVPKVPINFAVPPFRFYQYDLYIASPAHLLRETQVPEYYILTDRAGAVDEALFARAGYALRAVFKNQFLPDLFLFPRRKVRGYVNPSVYIFERRESRE